MTMKELIEARLTEALSPAALDEAFRRGLHALAIKARAPGEA